MTLWWLRWGNSMPRMVESATWRLSLTPDLIIVVNILVLEAWKFWWRWLEGLVEVDIPNTMLNETVISWSQWAWPFYLWRHCSKGRYKSLWLTTPPSHDDKCDQAQVCQWRPPPTPPPQLWDKQEPQLLRVKPGNISDGHIYYIKHASNFQGEGCHTFIFSVFNLFCL